MHRSISRRRTIRRSPRIGRRRTRSPDFTRLYYIREGEGWIRLRNRLYHPKPGRLVLLPAGMRLSYGRLNENGFGKYWCHFTAAVGK
ncbi:AraC family ligand binding domain-containing protein [Paenibacillus sp. P25]|nr:AraC family ligand binding domain-containing protein [Paenibacillus sp. P25]